MRWFGWGRERLSPSQRRRGLPFQKYRHAVARRRRFYWKLAILGLLAAIFLGFPSLRLALVSRIAERVPVSYEVGLGEDAYASLARNAHLVEDAGLEANLACITRELLKGLPEEDRRFEFRFHILEDSGVNACALPGGHVFVNSGLLLEARSNEEIAGVLAHEIAHVTRRHALCGMIEREGTAALLMAFFGRYNDEAELLARLGSQYLLALKFSRDHEREADETGWAYLERARIDPRGLRDFFKRLSARDKAHVDAGSALATGALSLLSTHPAPPDRVAYLDAKWRASERHDGFTALDVNLPEFQARLRAALGLAAPEPAPAESLDFSPLRPEEPAR
ncbi:MAG: M48 family metallopeptidase [Planctomycetota bacterium]|nr:M48 family metallopeptidase [Planctomycetota bacterium]